MRYYANVGPDRGPVLRGTVPVTIDVLEAPDKPMPIGQALCIGRDDAGIAVWRLVVHDAMVPGRWLVVDREFRPVG
jgi:hypothetical protein